MNWENGRRNFPPPQPGAFPGGLNDQPTNIDFEDRSPESRTPGGAMGTVADGRRETHL